VRLAGHRSGNFQILKRMVTILKYVLITPARDEEQFIERTIISMLAQTVRPLKWVIVSDASTDRTDEIVSRYAAEHTWIELVRLPERRERHFAGKVYAFDAGKARVADLDYAVIGNLDADVSFDPDHFQFLLEKLGENQKLGVAGAPFVESKHRYDYRYTNIENVWGGCQLFRRECFEDIGGYTPVKGGCVDHIAVVSARMRGWQTKTFTEKVCSHNREMGRSQSNWLRAKFNLGANDYSVGSHPLWEFFRIFYQLIQSPLVVGGLALGCGFVWSTMRRVKRPVSSEFVAFTRDEQRRRLRRLWTRTTTPVHVGAAVSPPIGGTTLPRYVLITPARNEAEFIERTLESVAAQTVLPVKWVIVSDGSTDRTDEIVRKYAAAHPWIELVRMPERRERNFAGKVFAFNAGYSRVMSLDYEVLGSMDADISFDEGYFAFLLQKLVDNPKLGLVGTPFREELSPTYDYRFVSIEHVSGACQVFRRKCFEEIGGYLPIKEGGVDHIAVIRARMTGWKTRTFEEKVCLHNRPMGTAQSGMVKARFRNGIKDYVLGGDPIWQVFRTLYQLTKPPYVIGGVALIAGYIWAGIRRFKRPVSTDFVAFRRQEEMRRLRRLFLPGSRLQA